MKHLFIFAVILSAVSLCAEVQKAVITAGVLNVRVKPSTKSDSLLQLKRGAEVIVVEKGAEWTAIRPPENSSLYVSSPLIADGKLKSNGNLRAGSGVNFQSLGILPAGTSVTVIEDKNAWSRIAVPNADIRCYVATRYLKFAEALPAKKTENAPEIPAAKKIAPVNKDDIVSFRAEDLAELKKNYVAGTEKSVELAGLVKETSSKKYGKTYILRCKDGRLYHVAGIIPASVNREKEVKIVGISHVIYKWNSPIVEIEKISQK